MVTSPENFYSKYLKDKSEDEIRKVIRSLKNNIGRLRNKIENPNYIDEIKTCPTDETVLDCEYKYLQAAKFALYELGAEYKKSGKEQNAEDFNNALKYVNKIVFEECAALSHFYKVTVEISETGVNQQIENRWFTDDYDNVFDNSITQADFLDEISELDIGTWRHNYEPAKYGCYYCDGTTWDLYFHYSNGKKTAHFKGNNMFPYNYKQLLEVLGLAEN